MQPLLLTIASELFSTKSVVHSCSKKILFFCIPSIHRPTWFTNTHTTSQITFKSLPTYFYSFYGCGTLYVGQTHRHIHTRISEHVGVSSKTGNKLSVSQMSAVLTHHHLSKHTISNSDFTILTSGNSKFDLEMHESLLISKLKPILNNNISSMPLYLF